MKIVYFAGGAGTRFWPISRKKMPKQLIPLFDNKSTMQIHFDNMYPLHGWNNILISTTEDLVGKIKEAFPKLPSNNFITEPCRRDLGPAVGLSMIRLRKMGSGKEPVAILWTDNFIGNFEAFAKVLSAAEKYILKDPNKIIFIGQIPQFANENLGWIEIGNEIEKIEDTPIYRRESFLYRPSLEQAKEWLSDKNHLWNTGYFITTPDFVLSEYEKQNPKMYAQLLEIEKSLDTAKQNEVLQEVYPQMEQLHFDNVVLEGLDPGKTLVISSDFGWSDPGTLYALKQFLQKSDDDNVTKGKVSELDSKDCLLYNYVPKQLLSVIGLDGFVVVNTDDAILVTHKDNIPKIKTLLKGFEGGDLEKYL